MSLGHNELTRWSLEDVAIIFKLIIKYRILAGALTETDECHTPSLISLVNTVRQQAITWVNFDLDLCHIVSLGHNELTDDLSAPGAKASTALILAPVTEKTDL